MSLKKHQRGMGLLAWLTLIAVAIFFGMVGMKSLPVYMNHYKVVSIMKNVAGEPGANESSAMDFRRSFERRFDIDMVKHISHTDVRVAGAPGGERSLVLEYEVRVHMFYNVDAVYVFDEEVPIGSR